MASPFRTVCSTATLTLALAFSGTPATARPSPPNRALDTVHVPVVSRTDFVFDALTGPTGLVRGEAARLAGWFDGLNLGYGDTITLDTSGAWRDGSAGDAIAHVAADYGMLLSKDPAPITVGRPPAGSVRVVVSRSTASVPDCPDWGIGNTPTHNNTTTSNYGCALTSDFAAMLANPQDLFAQPRAYRGTDPMVSVKAIKAYREANTTGANNTIKSESSKGGN
jgi:pilus assembly protein CpaD